MADFQESVLSRHDCHCQKDKPEDGKKKKKNKEPCLTCMGLGRHEIVRRPCRDGDGYYESSRPTCE